MRHRLAVIVVTLFVCIVAGGAPSPGTPAKGIVLGEFTAVPDSANSSAAFITNQFLVKFTGDYPSQALRTRDNFEQAHGISLRPVNPAQSAARARDDLDGWFLATVPGQRRRMLAGDIEDAMQSRTDPAFRRFLEAFEAVKNDNRVEAVEPNWLVRPTVLPNDFYLNDGSLWNLDAIRAREAWDVTAGSDDVTVAVIDTGVDYAHPDLGDRIWTNPGELGADGQGGDRASNLLDDDGNGYVDDWRGWDFYDIIEGTPLTDDDNDPQDDNSHGTHVAGIIAASADNDGDHSVDAGTRLAGVAPGVRVMALKFIQYSPWLFNPPDPEIEKYVGTTYDASRAVIYAANMGADIINMSFGGRSRSDALNDAIKYAHDRNAVLVAAAGNDAKDISGFRPAESPYVITVGASNMAGARGCFSNFGTKLDVIAPGGDQSSCGGQDQRVLSALGGDLLPAIQDYLFQQGHNRDCCYTSFRGTSMAAPHVAGVAALVRSANPEFTPEEVRQVIRQSAARGQGSSWSPDSGFGVLDAAEALQLTEAPPAARITAPLGHTLTYGVVDLEGIALPEGGDYRIDVGLGQNPAKWNAAITGTAPVNNQPLGTVDLRTLNLGFRPGAGPFDLSIRLVVTGLNGTSEDRLLVRMDPTLADGWPRAIGNEFFGFSDVKPVAIADLDLDGTIEIVGAALFDSNVYVWRPDGTDAPGWPRQVFSSVIDFPSPPAVMDVDGNGDLEIVALTIDSHSLNVLNHDGSRLPGYPMKFTAAIGSQCLTPWFQSPSLLDVDEDGDRDLVIRCTATLFALDVATRTVIWSNPIDAGAFDPPGGAQVNAGVPAIGDLDADGEPEIVTAGYQRLYVFRRNGETYPGWPRQISSLDQYGRLRLLASPVSIADLDVDGRSEIVVEEGDADAFEPGTIHAIQADGTEAPGWPSTVPPTRRMLSGGPIVADLDTDGSPEVIVTTSHITVLDGRGDPAPGWNEALIGLGPTQVSPPSVADVDDDGELEILVADPDGSDEAGEGARVYKRWAGVIWERSHGYATSTPVAGDFNKDGRLEIAGALHDVKTARQQFYVWKYPQTDVPRGRIYWPSFRFDQDLTGAFGLDGVVGSGVDTDLDGFSDLAELESGTSVTDSCSATFDASLSGGPSLGWPADLYTLPGPFGRSVGRINIQDLVTFMGPVRRLDSTFGDAAYNVRWDVDGVQGVGLPDLKAVVQFLGHHCD